MKSIVKLNKKIVIVLALLISGFNCPLAAARPSLIRITTSAEDTQYLWSLAEDTWRCIDYFVAPETGFPYDSDHESDYTNTTNIGLYLTCLAAAAELGFIEREKASEKAAKILSSVEKIEDWNGFLNNWISVRGKTKAEEGDNALSDFNKLPAGIMVIRQEFPKLNKQCGRILDKIKWSTFYNSKTGNCYGGYDVVNKKLMRGMELLAGDTRLAAFLMIAAGSAPPEIWNKLKRQTEEHYGIKYFKPGWYGGGLFMQAFGGIFLDERQAVIGKSTANLAYVQMLYAEERGFDVWGWSSSYSPCDAYLGWGGLKGNIVTPHASVLAIIYYPNKVVENLRKLEALGARADYKIGSKSYAFGFRDAINLDTNEVTLKYLPALDQGMLFLSLANYLKDGVIWKLFEKDPIVKHAKSLIKDYTQLHPKYFKVYARRDKFPLKIPGSTKAKAQSQKSSLVIDSFNKTLNLNDLGGLRKIKDCKIGFDDKSKQTEQGYGLRLSYDVGPLCPTNVFTEKLNGINASSYNAVSFYLKGDQKDGYTHSFRIELESKNNGAVFKVMGVSSYWQKVTIPFRNFGGKLTGWDGMDAYWGGMITDLNDIKKISFVFDMREVSKNKGTIYVDDLSFERLDKKALKIAAIQLNDFSDSPIGSDGTLDEMDSIAGWSKARSKKANLKLGIAKGKKENALKLNYDLGQGTENGWVVIEKEFYLDLPEKYEFRFFLKGDGKTNNLEFKLIDENGSTFAKKLIGITSQDVWQEVVITSDQILYWWGGDKNFDRVRKISFAVSAGSAGKGTVIIDRLRILTKASRKNKNIPSK